RIALPRDAVFHSSRKEGLHARQYRAKQKALGMKPGWPDLEVIYRGRFIGIELKAGKGRLSERQRIIHREIALAGGLVCVARSLDEVASSLAQLMPLRARIGGEPSKRRALNSNGKGN
ncbi:MAG: VRR-NUC domain-containing protein, partial [Amphiplicatus sp.]